MLACASLVFVAGLAVVSAPAASAHDDLIGVDPVAGAVLDVPPPDATFTFSAPVAAQFTAAAVTPPSGDEILLSPRELVVSDADVRVPVADLAPTAAAGTWAIVVRVVSVDGHPVESTLTFTAGAAPMPSATPAARSAAAPTSSATPTPSGASESPRTESVTTVAGESVSVDRPTVSPTLVAILFVVAVVVAGAGLFTLARRE